MPTKTLNYGSPNCSPVPGGSGYTQDSINSTGFVATLEGLGSYFRLLSIDLVKVFGTSDVIINKVKVNYTVKDNTSLESTANADISAGYYLSSGVVETNKHSKAVTASNQPFKDTITDCSGMKRTSSSGAIVISPCIRIDNNAVFVSIKYTVTKVSFVVTYTMPSYTIKFVNYDGTVLQSSNVEYGQTPSYSGPTPTRKSTAEYSYAFSCWDKTITAVTGTTTYTARYTATKRKYTIKIEAQGEGSTSNGGIYEYGSSISLTATPSSGYKFVKWSDNNTNASREVTVTGDKTYIAYFEPDNIYIGTAHFDIYLGASKSSVYVGTTKILG